MTNSFKYRFLSLVLVGVFMLFNIGIPIVIASCPMMKASVRGACCPTQPVKGLPILKTQRDYSCCKTVIAADRNKTEFLQTHNDGITHLLNYSTAVILYASNVIESTTFSKLILNDTHSLPFIEDIPIFTSSLLI